MATVQCFARLKEYDDLADGDGVSTKEFIETRMKILALGTFTTYRGMSFDNSDFYANFEVGDDRVPSFIELVEEFTPMQARLL
jgi:hypothetical protein